MTVSQTSAYDSTCTSYPLCLALNSEKRARMHSLLLHMSLTHPVWFWLRHKCFKGMSTSPWGSKGLHIRDPLCAKGSIPLNPAALMCHIVAPFSSLIPTLSLSPMEVISRALFLPDQRVGGALRLAMSHAQLQPRVTGDDWDWPGTHSIHCGGLPPNKSQNNDE